MINFGTYAPFLGALLYFKLNFYGFAGIRNVGIRRRYLLVEWRLSGEGLRLRC